MVNVLVLQVVLDLTKQNRYFILAVLQTYADSNPLFTLYSHFGGSSFTRL